MARPVEVNGSGMDLSLQSWIENTRTILNFPITILSIVALLVAGTFAETAPRKSLEFLDHPIGKFILFLIPFFFTQLLNWPSGLLAATVSLIFLAKLHKPDVDEGFMDSDGSYESGSDTQIIPNAKRWFIERVLGETPVAISSGRVVTYAQDDENPHSTFSRSSGSSSSNK
jgi:hypothetical protein